MDLPASVTPAARGNYGTPSVVLLIIVYVGLCVGACLVIPALMALPAFWDAIQVQPPRLAGIVAGIPGAIHFIFVATLLVALALKEVRIQDKAYTFVANVVGGLIGVGWLILCLAASSAGNAELFRKL